MSSITDDNNTNADTNTNKHTMTNTDTSTNNNSNTNTDAAFVNDDDIDSSSDIVQQFNTLLDDTRSSYLQELRTGSIVPQCTIFDTAQGMLVQNIDWYLVYAYPSVNPSYAPNYEGSASQSSSGTVIMEIAMIAATIGATASASAIASNTAANQVIQSRLQVEQEYRKFVKGLMKRLQYQKVTVEDMKQLRGYIQSNISNSLSNSASNQQQHHQQGPEVSLTKEEEAEMLQDILAAYENGTSLQDLVLPRQVLPVTRIAAAENGALPIEFNKKKQKNPGNDDEEEEGEMSMYDKLTIAEGEYDFEDEEDALIDAELENDPEQTLRVMRICTYMIIGMWKLKLRICYRRHMEL